VFEKGKDRKADIESALKTFKSSFTLAPRESVRGLPIGGAQ
jgi:hypothetical protein